jgi:hypothetical protein
VQVLPPDWTLQVTDTFDSTSGTLFAGGSTTGNWSVGAGLTSVTAPAGTNALKLANLGADIAADSIIEVEAKFKLTSTSGVAGIAFDVYSSTDFKFVAVDEAADKVLVGHFTARDGWVIDRSFNRTIAFGSDVTLKLLSNGASLSIYANGSLVGNHSFNAALVDGEVGMLARGGRYSFDSFTLRANDRALANHVLPPSTTVEFLHADTLGIAARGGDLKLGEAQALLDAAIRRLSLTEDAALMAAVARATLRIEDLDGTALATWDDGVITIDIDAAGHGWYVDLTPEADEEFDASGLATFGSARDRMDLLSVLMHELGHGMGLEHGQTPWMGESLSAGWRSTPTWVPATSTTPGFELPPYGMPPATPATPVVPASPPNIDWNLVAGRTVAAPHVAASNAIWVRDFVQHLGRDETTRNPNASLRVQLPLSSSVTPDARVR